MKNTLNLILLFSFLLASVVTVWVYYQVTNRIGDVKFDSNIDSTEFVLCDKNSVEQYYSVATTYKGGPKKIRKDLSELANNLRFKKSGMLTFRFVVNCKGETGMFRVKSVDDQLDVIDFDAENILLLKNAINKLDNWIPGNIKNKSTDSYYLIHFKIENAKITAIF